MQRNFLFAAGSLALLLGGTLLAAPSAHAQDFVTPGDTFSFDVSGYDSTGATGYYLTPAESGTFGATTTFTGAGPNGQDITITSGETIGATTTTDTFTVSTPTSFLTTANVNGTKITRLYFDLGLASGTDPVNVVLPISSSSATGSVVYGAGNTKLAITPVTTLGTGNLSYSAYEGVSGGTTSISQFALHSFTYAITYATLPVAAPEPSPYAALAIGAIGLGALSLKARRRQAA